MAERSRAPVPGASVGAGCKAIALATEVFGQCGGLAALGDLTGHGKALRFVIEADGSPRWLRSALFSRDDQARLDTWCLYALERRKIRLLKLFGSGAEQFHLRIRIECDSLHRLAFFSGGLEDAVFQVKRGLARYI